MNFIKRIILEDDIKEDINDNIRGDSKNDITDDRNIKRPKENKDMQIANLQQII